MDVRAERQDLRDIAALEIDLDDKERKEPKDAGYKCARHLLEALLGEVHRAADYSIANGTINQDLSIALDISIKPGEKFTVQLSRTDSHCPLQRTILMVASPPPSDGTLYVCVLQLERGGFTGCSSGPTVDGS